MRTGQELIYRGYKWVVKRGPGAYYLVVASAFVIAPVETSIGLIAANGARAASLMKIAREQWRYVRTRRDIHRDMTLEAFDGVPWEIHDIEDETAYEIALRTYYDEGR